MTRISTDLELHRLPGGQFLHLQQKRRADLTRVQHRNRLLPIGHRPAVADLATFLGVHRAAVHHHEMRPVFRERLDHRRLTFALLEPDKLRLHVKLAICRRDDGFRATRRADLRVLGLACVILVLVHVQAVLDRHQLGQVDRETEGRLELECGIARKHAALCLLHLLVEKLQPAIERLVEQLLLGIERLDDLRLCPDDLRENLAKLRDQCRHQLAQKRPVRPTETDRAPVAHRATQDAAQHVIAPGVVWKNAVGDAETQGADVIGDHAERDIDLFLLAELLAALRQRRGVHFATHLLQIIKDRAEHIGLVVGYRFREIREPLGALDERAGALEAHPGIHVAGWQRPVGAVRLGVVLDEDEVPQLDACRVVGVDQLAPAIALRRQVDVQFRTRPARPGVTHLPEVVLDVAVDDVHCRVEPRLLKQRLPDVVGFLVELPRITLRGAVD